MKSIRGWSQGRAKTQGPGAGLHVRYGWYCHAELSRVTCHDSYQDWHNTQTPHTASGSGISLNLNIATQWQGRDKEQILNLEKEYAFELKFLAMHP